MQQLIQQLNWRKVIMLSAVFLFTGLIVGCKKEKSPLGQSALDPDLLLSSGGIDTFSIVSYSEFEDSSRTDNQRYGVVGAYVDPVFGTMASSVYTQFRLSGGVSFASTDQFTMDSCVLALEYGGYYGKPNPQTFEVYQIAEALDVNSPYYRSDSKLHATANLISSGFNANIEPDFISEVIVGTDTLAPQLRLHLDTTWAKSLLIEARDGTAFDNNTNFTAWFKGLHIKVADESPASDGAVYYLKMTDPNSKLTIYFHENNQTSQSQFDFVLNSSGKYFNHVELNNTGTSVEEVVTQGALNNQQEFYAQAHNVKAKVLFPTLGDISSKALIHDALLVLPVAYQTGFFYPPAANIIIFYNENGLTRSRFATYDDSYKGYVIDVRSYIQAAALGQIANEGLTIFPSNMGGSAERIRFNGSHTYNKVKPRLIIKYTDFN